MALKEEFENIEQQKISRNNINLLTIPDSTPVWWSSKMATINSYSPYMYMLTGRVYVPLNPH
jgi:hypothetical protein